MRDRAVILDEVYSRSLNAEGRASQRQDASLEVLLDIRDLLGKDLPKMLVDINNSIQAVSTWVRP